MFTVNVTMPERLLRRMTTEAKKAFPLECFGAVLGNFNSTDGYEIKGLWYPGDLSKHSSHTYVTIPDYWAIQANEAAEELGCRVIGSHHSHPYRVPDRSCPPIRLQTASAPSIGDWQCGWQNLCVITGIFQFSTGRRWRTQTNFFGPVTNCRTYTIKGNGKTHQDSAI